MMSQPAQITLSQWDNRYRQLQQDGLKERFYGGPLSRHIHNGDTRLTHLKFDNSPAALALWNLLLTENDRLHKARKDGKKIVGTMKDLGTISVLAYSFENMVAFYPDGAWWTPCIMEQNEGLFDLAAKYGLDESYCPVRAMLGAFINQDHFPIPDTLICSVGAVCDDFSAIAQRLEHLGFAIHWWHMPHRRQATAKETAVSLPGQLHAPTSQVRLVRSELEDIITQLEQTAGQSLTESMLVSGIQKANQLRTILRQLRSLVYSTQPCPFGSLEILIAEMLAIHFCSDYEESIFVLQDLLAVVQERIRNKSGILPEDTARVFWVNPVADLRVMNLLEECGGQICGTEYLFSHALDLIPEDVEPLEALARTALADPMVGSTHDRAARIQNDIQAFGAEALIISRIPGASHCAYEGRIIGDAIRNSLDIPVLEIEIPSLCDSLEPSIRTRLEALIETIKQRRCI